MTMKRSARVLLGSFFAAALLCTGCAASAAASDFPTPSETGSPLAPAQADSQSGWQIANGETYYQIQGEHATGWLELDGSRYYFRGNGTMVTGWLSLEGQRYYLGADGAAVRGVQEIDGTRYVFDHQGLLTSGWAEADGKRYYGDRNCHPVEGWQEIGGSRYYFGADYAAWTGWLEQDGFTYYFMEDGSTARGAVEIDGTTHYFAFNGQEIILANPWTQIPDGYTVELADIGFGHQIAEIAYQDYKEMVAACWAVGLDPAVCSSYRTVEYQTRLFNKKVDTYVKLGYDRDEAAAIAGTEVAVPGTSEHHLGLALDIVDNSNWTLDESQAKTATQKWLMENSWRFGWILRYPDGTSSSTGIIYEPWHYRYVGREVASDIYASGLCLEDYLKMLTE